MKNISCYIANIYYIEPFFFFKKIQKFKNRKNCFTIGGQAEVPLIATDVNRGMLKKSLEK